MSAGPYFAAISAISELPRSFPVSNIPPGIFLSITRNDPKLSVHVIETAREGLVKAYALSLEFSLHCKVGNTVLVLDPSPFILPNGSLNVEVFNATYRTFFHAKNNMTMKEWLDALDYTPLDLATFLTKWVLAKNPKSLLEPSCGDGAFVDALAAIGANSIKSLTAFDIEASETAKVRRKAKKIPGMESSIHTKDFLAWALKNFDSDQTFDAAVGNSEAIMALQDSKILTAVGLSNAEREELLTAWLNIKKRRLRSDE